MPTKLTNHSFVLPLKVSANRRFLVDQIDQPFLIHGDTAWSLITALAEDEVEHYLADRAAKGFNAIIAAALTKGGRTLIAYMPTAGRLPSICRK